MSLLAAVVVLLAVIVVLLCEPQERRTSALRSISTIAFIIYAGHHVLPFALAFIVVSAKDVLKAAEVVLKAAFHHSVRVAAAVAVLYVVALPIAGWLDAKRNREIRAGSVQAFDKRVQELERSNFSHEEAVEAAMSIKNGH